MNIHRMPPNLDEALKEAFRRQEPPDGFADRVMARVPERRSAPPPRWKREWLAIAASTCVAVIGAGAWQQHQRQIEGERAKQQLIYALTVASESLQVTKQMVTR
jgi:hypothetical protein